MDKNNALSWVASGITIFTGAALEDVAGIILTIIGIVSAIVSLSYNVYCWWEKAKKDGKIDKKELDEAKQMLDNSIEDIKDLIDKEDK